MNAIILEPIITFFNKYVFLNQKNFICKKVHYFVKITENNHSIFRRKEMRTEIPVYDNTDHTKIVGMIRLMDHAEEKTSGEFLGRKVKQIEKTPASEIASAKILGT